MPESPTLVEFGRRVAEARRARGETQNTLAKRCGLHPTYIGGIERGRRNISLRNLLKLIAALEVDATELLRGLHEDETPVTRVQSDDEQAAGGEVDRGLLAGQGVPTIP